MVRILLTHYEQKQVYKSVLYQPEAKLARLRPMAVLTLFRTSILASELAIDSYAVKGLQKMTRLYYRMSLSHTQNCCHYLHYLYYLSSTSEQISTGKYVATSTASYPVTD